MGKNKPLSKIVFKNTFYNFTSRIISKILGLIFVVVLARALQPELFGLYNIVFSVVFIFLTFSDLGINTALIKYVASNLNKKEIAASYVSYLFKLKVYLSLGFSALLIILAKPLADLVFKKPELFSLFLLTSLYILLASLIDFFSSFFYPFNEIKYVPIQESVFQVIRILVVFSFLFLISKTLINVFFALIITNIFMLAFVFFIVRKKYFFLLSFKSFLNKKEKKKVISYTIYLTIANLSAIFFTYIDVIMLGIFLDASYVGFYKAAQSLVTTVSGLMAITSILFPIFSQLDAKRSGDAFRKVFRYSAILSFPASFGLALIAKPFINVLYGTEYLPSTLPLFALSFLILAPTASLFPVFFSAKEKPEWPAKMMIIASVLNCVLNFILIKTLLNISPLYATLGAAIATLASNFFFYLSLVIIAKKEFKLFLEPSSIYKPLIASLVMVVFLISFNIVVGLTWPMAIFEVIFGAIVYFIILFFINGIKKSDFVLFKNLLGFNPGN